MSLINKMKKALLTFILALCSGYIANAQVYVMPKTGVSFSNIIHRHSDFDSQRKAALTFGIALDMESLKGPYAVQPELLYVRKGYKYQGATYTYNYLDLPILGKYIIGKGRISGYALAGPFIGFGINGRIKEGDETARIKFAKEPEGYEGNDMYLSKRTNNRIDAGFQFGGGLSMYVGSAKWVLDARYSLGVTNLNKSYKEVHEFRETIITNTTIGDGKFRSFYITAGFAYPIY